MRGFRYSAASPTSLEMRLSLSGGFPRFVLLVSAVVLLLTAVLLGLRPAPAFGKRDAFVAALERGERQLRPERMAHEWRSELDAQSALLRRDRWLGGLLAGAGLLAIVGFARAGGRIETGTTV